MKVNTKKRLIYLRYILPLLIILSMLALILLPSYRYVNASEGNVEDPISLIGLMGNSYNSTRKVLFGTDEPLAADLSFARSVFVMLIVVWVLYILSLAAAVYSTYVAMKFFGGEDDTSGEKTRAVFATIFPNRILLCLTNLLSLALPAFAYLLPSFFINENIILTLVFPDALIICGILLVAVAVLSIFTAPYERQFDADIFKRRRPFEKKESAEEPELQKESDYAASLDGATAERNARLRELLLGGNDSSDDQDK